MPLADESSKLIAARRFTFFMYFLYSPTIFKLEMVDWSLHCSKLALVYSECLCFIASIFSHLWPYIHCTKGRFYNYSLTQVWSLLTSQISPSLSTAPFQRKCYGFKELTRSVPRTWIFLSSYNLRCNGRGNVSWKLPSNSVNHSHSCDTINQICLNDVTLWTTIHAWFSAKDA